MKISLLTQLVCLLIFCAGTSQSYATSRARESLRIADFESLESLKKWSGLVIEQTSAHASHGKFGIKFDIPSWKKGEEERPRIVLAYSYGDGFPLHDFAPYGEIAVDVWVAGNEPGRMGLKLRDGKDRDSWTTWADILPGKKNVVKLKIVDASADINIHDVQEIVLYGLRPAKPYTLIVDNLRLLPRPKPPLTQFSLGYPNYRNLIFPNSGDIEVLTTIQYEEYGLQPNQLTISLTMRAGDVIITDHRAASMNREKLKLSHKSLPAGLVLLTASVVKTVDGSILAKHEWPLTKLTDTDASAIKVSIDRKNAAIVDGKPFFPLGFYAGGIESQMEEIADSPFNCILDYGANNRPKADMLAYMDKMQQRGLKLIYCMNDLYPSANYVKSWEGMQGNSAIARAVIKAYRTHPALLAWYINDEIPADLAPKLKRYYTSIRTADPDHPCYIVHCNHYALPYFADGTDVMGIDPYPIPKNAVTEVSDFLDFSNATADGHKPTWVVPQAFGWYQYGEENKNRAHIPTDEELKSGRAPTYEESRCMTYLSLVHGAKGLIYYCYYDMRVLPQYDKMWSGMKKIAAEVRTLAPMLLSSDDYGEAEFTPKSAALHSSVKFYQGRWYLLSVNAENAPVHVDFDLTKLQPLHIRDMFNSGVNELNGTRLSADYFAYEARVFEIESSPLPPDQLSRKLGELAEK